MVNWAVLISGILAAICILLAGLKFSTVTAFERELVPEELYQVVEEINDHSEEISFLSGLFSADLGESIDKLRKAISSLLLCYRLGLVFSAVLVLAAVVCVWLLKQRSRYLPAFGLALGSTLILALTGLVFIPFQVYSLINKLGISDAAALVTSVTLSDIIGMLSGIRTVPYYLAMILEICLAAVSLAGCFSLPKKAAEQKTEFLKEEKVQREKREPQQALEILPPAIRGIAGEYAGGIIELQPGEEILIGCDSGKCNLVLSGPQVSPEHCSVMFDHEKGLYMVKDLSDHGTYRNHGIPLKKGKYEAVERNSYLIPGNEENIFLLE